MKATSHLNVAFVAILSLLTACKGSGNLDTGMETGMETGTKTVSKSNVITGMETGMETGTNTSRDTSTNTSKDTSRDTSSKKASKKSSKKSSKKGSDSSSSADTQGLLAGGSNQKAQDEVMQKVKDNVQHSKFVASKVKFSIEMGTQKVTLTGNLKMKRDDVIRLQLMAFGFVEAGRLEFTNDYVLLMDRINKQYLKAPYTYIDFLRNSGINFYTLQGLFWNELFLPGSKSVSKSDMSKFTTTSSDGDMVISYESGRISYSWLADEKDGLIRMANILFKDRLKGNSQLNWDYQGFQMFEHKKFPTDMAISLTSGNTEVKLGVVLNYLTNESDWETRTTVSNKYREVTIDEILRRFMSM